MSQTKSVSWLLLFVSFCVSMPAQESRAAVDPPAVRVQLNVVVTQANGGSVVADLNETDFRVFDNGEERPIRTFEVKKLDAGYDGYLIYKITVDAAVGKKPHEYHRIEVRVNRRGLDVKARRGYYAELAN